MQNQKEKQPRGRQAASRVGGNSPQESVMPVYLQELHFLLTELNDFNDHDFTAWIRELGHMTRNIQFKHPNRDRDLQIQMLAEMSRLFLLLWDNSQVILSAKQRLDDINELSPN